MAERPPVPPGVREPLPAWIEEAESGDLRDLAKDLPALLLFIAAVVMFLAVLIAVILTLVQLAKFPWLAGG